MLKQRTQQDRAPRLVLQEYVPCTLGPMGRHPVTIAIARDWIVETIEVLCRDDCLEQETVERLNQPSCLKAKRQLREALKTVYRWDSNGTKLGVMEGQTSNVLDAVCRIADNRRSAHKTQSEMSTRPLGRQLLRDRLTRLTKLSLSLTWKDGKLIAMKYEGERVAKPSPVGWLLDMERLKYAAETSAGGPCKLCKPDHGPSPKASKRHVQAKTHMNNLMWAMHEAFKAIPIGGPR